MKKHTFLLAVFLGIVLPWILFAGKESSIDQPQQQTASTEQPSNGDSASDTITVAFADGQIKEMDLEQYILGVLIGEMPESFHIESMKAQAVVARTFAVKSLRYGYKHEDCDVCTDSSCCQSYYDAEMYAADGGAIERFQEAVELTKGQVLVYENELIEATYFSCSGGKTEDAQAVWGTDVPYLRSKNSPGEENADHYTDTVTFSAEEFQKLMGQEFSGVPGGWIGAVSYTNGGGVDSIEIDGISYTGTQVRQRLGLYSTAFVISAVGDRITITTKGFGHRVGMSQYGADAMAEQGNTFQQILSYYFPGTALDLYKNV